MSQLTAKVAVSVTDMKWSLQTVTSTHSKLRMGKKPLFKTLFSPKTLVTTSVFVCRLQWRRQWKSTPVFLPGESCGQRSLVGCCPWGRTVRHDWSDLACMHALEKEMATHSSILAWKIPGTEEPGGLSSMGSQSWTRLKQFSSSSSSRLQKGIATILFILTQALKGQCHTRALVTTPTWPLLGSQGRELLAPATWSEVTWPEARTYLTSWGMPNLSSQLTLTESKWTF